jgi:hypothetical protein
MTIIETLRGPKIAGMALFDWVFSLLGAYMAGRFLKLNSNEQWLTFVIFWILLGVVAHVLFKVPTQFGYYLGLNPRVR